jgi:hypothetical protein
MENIMLSKKLLIRAVLLVAAWGSGWALAQEAPAPQEARNVEVLGFGVPMQATQLDSFRGGFDLVKNDMQLSGTVANNSAANVIAGNNSIADGAFTNASGLPMVIQNSGSNVLIQNATIVNVQLQ